MDTLPTTWCGTLPSVESIPDNTVYPEPIPERLGDILQDGDNILRRVRVVSGYGRWMYWKHYPITEPYAHHNWDVVADTEMNPLAPHIAGYSQKLITGDAREVPEELWIVVKGYTQPLRQRKIYVEDEDEGLPRLERR